MNIYIHCTRTSASIPPSSHSIKLSVTAVSITSLAARHATHACLRQCESVLRSINKHTTHIHTYVCVCVYPDCTLFPCVNNTLTCSNCNRKIRTLLSVLIPDTLISYTYSNLGVIQQPCILLPTSLIYLT